MAIFNSYVNVYLNVNMENHQFLWEIHYKLSFSIAMLNYQRVPHHYKLGMWLKPLTGGIELLMVGSLGGG